MQKPKLNIRKINDTGIYCYAVYRADSAVPIIKDISNVHARHILKILKRMSELPAHIEPIKDWYNWDVIVSVDQDGYGKHEN